MEQLKITYDGGSSEATTLQAILALGCWSTREVGKIYAVANGTLRRLSTSRNGQPCDIERGQSCKPYPFTDEQLAWFHDLETTTEPQTMGALHRIEPVEEFPIGWCCLGRGAAVLKERPYPCSEDDSLISFRGSTVQLFAYRRLDLRSPSGELLRPVPDSRDPKTTFGHSPTGFSALTELNDELRWTFPEIAAYCREHPWNVFTDPAAKHAEDCPHFDPTSTHLACECGFYKRDWGAE